MAIRDTDLLDALMPLRHVLLVEDDPAIAQFVESILNLATTNRYRVTTCGSIDAGEKAYATEDPDLVLLDLGLPDATDDLDALRKAMTWEPEPCVVVLTSHSAPELGIEALREGAHDFLLKSTITPGMIERVLGYAFERHDRRVRRQHELGSLYGKVDNLEAYVSSVSHDLRAPLGTSLTMTALLRDRDGDLPPDQRGLLLDRIHASVERALAFADDLLEDARRGDEGRSMLDLDELANEAVALHRVPEAVLLEVGPFPDGVWGRPAGIRQMLGNLVGNALRHVAEPGRIRIHGQDLGSDVRLFVEDNGPGVPAPNRTKIFDLGHSGEGSTGLGLSTVQRQASVHGGRVWVDTSPDLGGARFTISLPMRSRWSESS